jgi:hypothetical protein
MVVVGEVNEHRLQATFIASMNEASQGKVDEGCISTASREIKLVFEINDDGIVRQKMGVYQYSD